MNKHQDPKEDLIGRMADTLRQHSEPYEEGAWERFVSQHPGMSAEEAPDEGEERDVAPLPFVSAGKSRKLKSLWGWGIVAATLLLGGMVFFWPGSALQESEVYFADVSPPADSDPIRSASGVSSAASSGVSSPVSSGVSSAVSSGVSSAVSSGSTHALVEAPTGSESIPAASRVSESTPVLPPLPQARTVSPSDAIQPAVITPISTLGVSEIDLKLATHSAELPVSVESSIQNHPDPYAWLERSPDNVLAGLPRGESNPRSSALGEKWDLGLTLASAMTTEQLNVGGGLSVAYRLSDKLSLRSGMSLGKLGVNTKGARNGARAFYATGNREPTQDVQVVHPSVELKTDSKPVRYTRQLNATTSDLLMLDIPLDMKYAWTKRFYTSLGVSFLGVLNEERTYHFVDRINEPVFSENASLAGHDIKYSVRAIYVEERASEHPLHGKGYAGFVNFSIGHRTPLSRKVHVSLEPFFKLPIGRLSQEDMNLTNGGIRIVTGF